MMNEAKKKRLIERGWKVGGVEEFLQLSPDEAAYVELRLKLSDSLRAQRQKKNLTQVELAKLVKSSQSRVAKMEAGDSSISLDLLIRSLLALGASNRDLANMIVSEGIEDYCLNKAMDEARDAPLLSREEALKYLEE